MTTAAAMILTAVCATAQAPDATATGGQDQWDFGAGLYGWFPGMSGSVGVRNIVEVPIDLPFSKIFDQLEFGLTGHFEGGRVKVSFGLDLMYVAAPVSGQIPEPLDASVNLRQLVAEGFGYYRVAQGSGENPWKLELLGGVRFWDINTSFGV
jgi:hypothetical protein